MLHDLRYGLRMLAKHKGFTVVAVLTLALGIGANTAMFSVLNTYLFQSLPYPSSDRLVRVFRTSIHSQRWPFSVANFYSYRERNTVFESLVAYNGIGPNLAEEGTTPERLSGLATTADFFPTLGGKPILGRAFTSDEDQPGASPVVVLSHRFWMRRYAGDPNIIGKTLRLDGVDVKVVGVMNPGFDHPLLWGTIDVWRPFAFPQDQRQNRGNNFLRMLGKLKPGVTQAQAEQSMIALVANLSKEFSSNANESVRLEPLHRSTSDDIGRKVMWFTFGLAGFVLLIGCANLANLQMARTATRAREFAIRAALGSGRRRLMRQSLIESLLVSLLGGAISVVLAWWSVKLISNQLFTNLPGATVSLDPRVFAFAFACSVITGIAFGVIPAWLASRADVNQALRENSRGASAGRAQIRLRGLLIVGEVAFALILLTGAGLFLLGILRFMRADPGWRVDGLLTAQVSLRGTNYASPVQRGTFFKNLEEKLRAIPGVESVSFGSSQVVYGFNSSGGTWVEGLPEPERGKFPEVFFEAVSDDYFKTLGVRLLEGRNFEPSDSRQDGGIIVNESFARRFWPNEGAVGKRVGRSGPNAEWREIIGVVNDMQFPASLSEPYTRLEAFRPMSRSPANGVSIFLRTSTPESVANDLRSTIKELDPTQPVNRIMTARAIVTESLGSLSLLGTLLGSFALLGLLLAAIGIYGVTSYAVVQRTGEFGIRMALGAQRRNVLWLVIRKSGFLVAIGALAGFAGSYATARILASTIPTLPSSSPSAMFVLTAVLLAVGLLACYVPALRATRVDPLVALREQ